MCGRYTFFTTQDDLEAYFEALVSRQGSVVPVPNVTPGSVMPVVAIGREKAPVIPTFRWGLIPSWAKDASVGFKMINARRETLHERPAFSALLERRRCLIPATGFYEAKRLLTVADRPLIAFAGLYDRWTSPSGEDVFSYTIITTQAEGVAATVHDRMPVILPKSRHKDWLDNGISVRDHLDMLLETDSAQIRLE
jgi:putative SOS response-associated peptidase YedK